MVLSAIVAALYWPGLYGGFVLDDYPQLIVNDALTLPSGWGASDFLAALASSESGPLGRPVAMATLVLQRTSYGLDPWAFKLFNLSVHLANTLLVFLLARRLFEFARPAESAITDRQKYYAALWASAVWALHPYNLTGVLYVVQRMTSLSAAFSLLAILAYLKLRSGRLRPAQAIAYFLGFVLASLMAILSKETALLIPVFCFLVELLFKDFRKSDGTPWKALAFGYGVIFVLPLSWLVFKLVSNPDWLPGMYAGRTFDLSHRLGSEIVILWIYLRNIFVPDINSMGLHHDDFPFIQYPLGDPFVLLCLAGHLAVLVAAWCLRRRHRFFAFGVGFFYAGHLLESTFWPLELIYEHRNYLPTVGVSIMCAAMFLIPWRSETIRRAVVAFAFLLLLFFGGATLVRSSQWGDPITFAMVEAEKHPLSGRANFDAGRELVVLMLRLKNPDPSLGVLAVNYLEKSRGKGMVTVEPYMVGFQGKAQLNLVLPDGYFEQFATQLREGYIPNGLYGLAQGMLSLSRFKNPPLSVENMEYLYEQALMNPRVGDVGRGHLLTAYSIFAAETQENMERAEALSGLAVQAAPDFIPFKQNAALMAYAAGHQERAMQMLAEIEAQDKLGMFKRETSRLKKLMNI